MNDRSERENSGGHSGRRHNGSGRGGERRSSGSGGPRRDGRQGQAGAARDGRQPRSSDSDRDRSRREGDRPGREGDRPRREGDRNTRDRRSEDRPWEDRKSGDGKSYGRGGTRGGGRSDRGGREREYSEAERLQHELRPVRSDHTDPVIPDDVRAKDLHPAARNELKTLQAEVQERVARHLAMVAFLIDDDPELAHQHALSAVRRAGRIPVTRETLAITAYRTGDFALSLRELRTYRRLSGLDTHIALMVDSERGLGRPERAIETGLAVERGELDVEQRVHLAIAMSGARLDLGQLQQALFELEIPELNPTKAFSWSPELFAAYAAVLEDLGRADESARWQQHADRAAAALQEHHGGLDALEVFEVSEVSESEEPFDERAPVDDAGDADGTRESADAAAPAVGKAEPGEAGGTDVRSDV